MTREFTMTAKLQGFMEAQAELLSASPLAVRSEIAPASAVAGIQPPSAK